MKWLKRLGIALGALVALLAIAAAIVFLVWKPWVPPAEMTDPAPDGRRIQAGDVIGNFYPGAGAGRRPGILLVGGSEGALGAGTTRIARALRGAGFSVLHLAYFRAPGQPEALALIPLERFDRGLALLKAQPEVDGARIAVVGGSKGAEAALLIGSRHPELRGVVAGMPSSVVWPGIDWDNMQGESRSSWSVGGKALPALPYGSGSWSDLASIYRSGLSTLPQRPETRIPVSASGFPLLLVCGEQDGLWPSCLMARQVKAAAPARVTLLAYKDAGHGVFGIPVDGDTSGLARMGGTPDGNQRARQDGWPKVLAFLAKATR